MNTLKQKLVTVSALSLLYCGISTAIQAAPLPNGTVLGIDQGVGADTNIPCTTGSCFGMELAPGLVSWIDVNPGTDGGLIIGKNQASGGQDLSQSSSTPGEVTATWSFLGVYGTYSTPAGTTNIFSDTSCAGASCIGQTELRSWNWVWNGFSAPFASANGCLSTNCSADQLAGIFVTEWTTGSSAGSPYTLKYSTVIPDNDPSGFGGVRYNLILKGSKIPPAPLTPAISGLWPAGGPPGTFVFVFGENFIDGDSSVQVNGIASPFMQVLTQDVLIFMLPEGNTIGPVRVTTSKGSATSTSSFGMPTTGLSINGIWPATGSPGEIVFLFGAGFVTGTHNTQVTLNGAPVPIAQAVDENILFMLLPMTGVSTGPFTVTTPTATTTSSGFFTVK